MNEILRRNHDIYMRIEKFEDYEFFNCIAYEMFQRSIGIEPLNIQKQYQENSKGYLFATATETLATNHIHHHRSFLFDWPLLTGHFSLVTDYWSLINGH